MTDLDDPQALRLADTQSMLDAVLGMPNDCRAAYDSASQADGLPSSEGITSVTFCGMGGSAVSGDVVRSVFLERLGLPVEVNRSPVLPEHCGSHTLVVCSSYSGNTAETLAAFRSALKRGCRVLVVTSGGTIADEAADAGVASVRVPSGYQPRAALGHLGFASLGALETIGILPPLAGDVDEAVAESKAVLAATGPDVATEDNPAKTLATRIGDRFPVIWGADGIGSVAAARWKTQMNENGKLPAFWSSMSELDHNEVVGWTAPFGERFFVVGLRHDGEDPQLPPRFPLSYDIVRAAGGEVEEVQARGTSALARLMSLIMVGDLTSVYLAIGRGVDPTPVPVIERLKAALPDRDGVTESLPGPGDDLPQRAAKVVRAASELIPRVGLILGSGLGPALGDAFREEAGYAFTDLPGFPPPGVPGHAGRFALGHLAGVPVASFFGRVHFYEGHGMDVPALLPRLVRELGAETIVVTAAVGGAEPGLAGGTVAVITDHVNMMGTAPLRGWRYPDGMPAFVPMGQAYDHGLAELALERARALDVVAAPGVYAAMSGPAYETPAEIRLIGQAGATVVGMSMVPEVLPARALGMRVLGLAMVTNALGEPVSHEEVVRVSNETAKAVGRLLVDLLPRIDEGA